MDRAAFLYGETRINKPTRMRWRTFQKYLDRDAELADREDNYLWRF